MSHQPASEAGTGIESDRGKSQASRSFGILAAGSSSSESPCRRASEPP